MREQHIDAILLAQGTSLVYFAGIQWWGGERLFAMVLPAKGDAFFVSPAFEEGRAREQISKGPNGANLDVRIWQEDENPYDRVAQGLKDRGLGSSKLGIEETVKFVFSQGIAAASPQAQIQAATPITAGCRMIKSEQEVERMRLASRVTLAAYEAAYRALKPGMTKPDAEHLIEQAHAKLGFEGGADVQVGEYSAFPHGSVTPQVIREGSVVLVDGGCTVEGYTSDITRTFVLGKASDKMKKVFDIVHKAQSAALRGRRSAKREGVAPGRMPERSEASTGHRSGDRTPQRPARRERRDRAPTGRRLPHLRLRPADCRCCRHFRHSTQGPGAGSPRPPRG